jgi:hypothetical protein
MNDAIKFVRIKVLTKISLNLPTPLPRMKGEMFLIGLIVFEVSLEIGNDKFVGKWALKWRDNIERDDTLQNDAQLNDQ